MDKRDKNAIKREHKYKKQFYNLNCCDPTKKVDRTSYKAKFAMSFLKADNVII